MTCCTVPVIQSRQQEKHSIAAYAQPPFFTLTHVRKPCLGRGAAHSDLGLPTTVNTIRAIPEQAWLQAT